MFLCLELAEWMITVLQDCSVLYRPGNISLRSPLSLSQLCLAHETQLQGRKGCSIVLSLMEEMSLVEIVTSL